LSMVCPPFPLSFFFILPQIGERDNRTICHATSGGKTLQLFSVHQLRGIGWLGRYILKKMATAPGVAVCQESEKS
jgi:hypothetical protein